MWRVCLQTCSRFKAVISICCADKTSKLCVHESDNGSLWEALLLHIISQMGQHRACWRGRQGHILHPLDYVRFIFGIYSSTSVGLPSGCQAVNHSQALEHDVKLPQFDHQKLLPQTCHTDYPAGCNYLTFSPHLTGNESHFCMGFSAYTQVLPVYFVFGGGVKLQSLMSIF